MLFPIKDYNPTSKIAFVTIVLIFINVGFFIYQQYLSPFPFSIQVVKSALIPKEITHFRNENIPVEKDALNRIYFIKRTISPFLSIIFSLFMHGSWLHLLGNMLFLWIFGNNVEEYLGGLRFLFFYLVMGIGASLIHVIFNWNSLIPVIGASGAISGIMGAYLILYPSARIRTLVFILFFITFVDLPAFFFLIIWFVFQFFQPSSGNIAWLVHAGGFVLGIIMIKGRLRRKKYI